MSSRVKGWLVAGMVAALLASAAVGWALYRRQRTIVVAVNGIETRYHTTAGSTEEIVQALDVRSDIGDQASLPSRQGLADGTPLQIDITRHVYLLDNGACVTVPIRNQSLGEALVAASIDLGPGDTLTLGGESVEPTARMPLPAFSGRPDVYEIMTALREPLQVVVHRAHKVTLVDETGTISVSTQAPSAAHALYDAGIQFYQADRVTGDPMLAPKLATDLAVERSLPVALDIGGKDRYARTCAASVGELLRDERIVLGDLDLVQPGLDVAPKGIVHVIRVLVERYVEEIPVAFEELWEPDPDIEIDNREIKHWGREGAERKLWQVRYENDVEVDRIAEAQWTAREPINRVIRYGTKIVVRELDTPQGTIEYWRKVRMLATSYNAPTAGKPMDHPTYAITRMGLRARFGIIAVDPRVIPLGSDLYVPGYGPGMAGDTGGAIKWRRIDLCYDDDNLVLWKKWVDVYFLTPVPDDSDINWVITNWPRERD